MTTAITSHYSDNFLMGVGTGPNWSRVYVIDFGLAKKYKDDRAGRHIPYREDRTLTGTARYASTNAHRGGSLLLRQVG